MLIIQHLQRAGVVSRVLSQSSLYPDLPLSRQQMIRQLAWKERGLAPRGSGLHLPGGRGFWEALIR